MTAIAVEPYFTSMGEMSGQPLVLDDVRLAVLLDRVSQFKGLFATNEEMSFPVFRDWLEDPGTLVIGFYHAEEREPFGLGMVYGLLAGVDAKIQISFFDGDLKEREPIVRAFIGWVCDTVGVRRVSAQLPHFTLGMQRFLIRVGMVAEGRLKDWVMKEGKFLDLYLFGITARECDDEWRRGRSSAQPRVRVMKQTNPPGPGFSKPKEG